ncbi:MAG: stage II sporulation protein P [Syntrophothermus sp.]|uniref:stage II sporulation protein P n=1 Tax=Syntrophothermus sp. TaxID=2736299 RepID=UPI00257CF716|nr:stage II sporulation protein P [Syntrophothermus sp.]NSW83282.1 stage II sporulation protein P [Syntrophothermus sp.]
MNRTHFWHLVKGLVYVQVLAAVIIAGITFNPNRGLTQLFDYALALMKTLHTVYGLNLTTETAETVFSQSSVVLASPSPLVPPGVYGWLRVFFAGPEDMLFSHIQAMANVQGSKLDSISESENNVDSPPQAVSNDESVNKEEAADLKGTKLAFYCTHNGESYRPDCGESRLEGEEGHVNLVAAALQAETAKRGFTSFHVKTVHDYPDFAASYAKSRQTVQSLLEEHPDLAAIFDVHRDAYPQARPDSIEINGKSAARILIVVGTDERKPHPNWRKNAEFAQVIYEKGETMYPGLIKQVRFKAGTYNQEFHHHALLVEFGNDQNSLSEALYSAQLFADILYEVFKEGER